MGHIGQKGKQSMEKVIDKSQAYEATDLRGMISQSCCQIRSRLFWAEGFFCVCGRRIKDTGAPVHCMGCFRLLI